MLHSWLSGIGGLLHARELLFLALGMLIGLFCGALPWLGSATALALLTPLTSGLDPFTALALAGGFMGAVPMGGSITAILLNAPGAAPSAAACLDGYPLAQQGKAGLALGAAASAHAIGGIIGTIAVVALLPVAKALVLHFGPPELFLLAVLGLVVVSTASRGKMLRGLIAGGAGLMIVFIGYNDVSGALRFTSGIVYLRDGVHLIPALIGLFAVAEMINLSIEGGSMAGDAKALGITNITSGIPATFRRWRTALRGSLTGTVLGAIPGVGGAVAPLLSYSLTAQASKDPESFGEGNLQGVIAPEAATSAGDCSGLIPTFAFGVPSGVEMAVLVGLLVLHGLQPGPLMLIDHPVEIYGLIWALACSCVLASFLGLFLARPLSMLTLLDSQILVPILTAVALVGSYAIDGNIGNVLAAAIFGILGYMMIRFDYPRIAMSAALILGPAAERNFHQTALMSGGSLSVHFRGTVCLVLLAGIVALLVTPPFRGFRFKRAPRAVAAEFWTGRVVQMRRIFGTPFIEYLPAVAVAIFTAAFLATAYRYASQARALPAGVAWVTMLLIALDVVSRTHTGAGSAVRRRLNPGARAAEGFHPLGEQVRAMLWLAVFAMVLALIGALYAAPLYVFASLSFRGRRPWFTCLWISALFACGVWLLFAVVLRLDLYPGYLLRGS